MTDQKTIWANQAARYTVAADKAQAAAEAIYAAHEKYRGDIAFFTQPGRIIERERFHARTERAFELSNRAKRLREKAANLTRLATTNAGDALARHKAADQAVISAVSVGDMVSCVYGNVTVVKINRKSLLVQGRFGAVKIDAHLCKKLAA